MIAYGLQQELDHTEVARILGGGKAVRHIRKKEHVCFITHQTEEAAKRTLRIGAEPLMAEGWQCKRICEARFDPENHFYEINAELPKPWFYAYEWLEMQIWGETIE